LAALFDVLPDFKNNWEMALPFSSCLCWSIGGRFGIPVLNPEAAVSLLSGCWLRKSEKDSLGAVLFFNVAHYVLRPWPWILVGLARWIVYRSCPTFKKLSPILTQNCWATQIAYPRCLNFCRLFHWIDGRWIDRREFFAILTPLIGDRRTGA